MGKADSTDGGILSKSFKFSILKGYTLVEMMIVLAVMGFVAAMTIYALRSFNSSQPLINAQKEFVSNLRTAQARAQSGDTRNGTSIVQQISFGGGSYLINGLPVSLPAGVSVSAPANTTLCFPNPNLSAYDNTGGHACGACQSGVGFACVGVGFPAVSSSPVTVNFVKSGVTKRVIVSGSGMQIFEINALP